VPPATGPWAQLPPPRADDGTRQQIRSLRAASGLLLAALDDDPTGSQAVHGVQLVTEPDQRLYADAAGEQADVCFVLTNSRSLDEAAARRLCRQVAGDLYQVAGRCGRPLQLLSRSDSTLRGHVLAEVQALHDARQDRYGSGFDAVLFAPAYLEAGRVTAGDVHWART
jgi:uncharacterized protein YgbK (DUF1537 family)